MKRYTDRVQYIRKTNPVCVNWDMKLYKPFVDMGDLVWLSAAQFSLFRLRHGLLVQWSHTHNPVLYMWAGTRSHSWSMEFSMVCLN